MNYYSLGNWIVEEQQEGKEWAEYGKHVLKKFSESLTKEFGRGFSETNLEYAGKFISHMQTEFPRRSLRNLRLKNSKQCLRKLDKEQLFIVSWSQYLQLMRIENVDERKLYEIESAKYVESDLETAIIDKL